MAGNSEIETIGIFLGGMRCGSTAVNDYLKQHPEICVYQKKDPHFYSGDEQWSKGWDNYLAGWSDFDSKHHKITFESSTHYTKYPLYKNTAHRMASSPFAMKLIYGVRPPLERIESHFVHNAGKGYLDPEQREERLKLLEQAINVSNYELQISRFERYFTTDQILIIDTRALIDEHQAVLSEICRFLEVDDTFSFEPIKRRARRFKNNIDAITLTEEEKEIARDRLHEPIKRFEARYQMQLWDGDRV